MFHDLIRFDDSAKTTQRTAIVAWQSGNPNLPQWDPNRVGDREVLLFWTASSRPGGNLGLCGHDLTAIRHLVSAYLVCEIVFSSDTGGWFSSVSAAGTVLLSTRLSSIPPWYVTLCWESVGFR